MVLESVERRGQPALQIRIGRLGHRLLEIGRLERLGAGLVALDRPQPVQDHAGRDRVQPGRQRRLPAKLLQRAEGLDERLLGEVLGQVAASAHPVRQAEDPVDVRVVDLPFRGRIAPPRALDQFPLAHPSPGAGRPSSFSARWTRAGSRPLHSLEGIRRPETARKAGPRSRAAGRSRPPLGGTPPTSARYPTSTDRRNHAALAKGLP